MLLVLSLQKSTGDTSGNALNMENRGRQKDKGKGFGNRGNSRKGRSKSRLGKIECWNCGKKQRDGQQERNQEANVTGDVLQDDLILSVDNISKSLLRS